MPDQQVVIDGDGRPSGTKFLVGCDATAPKGRLNTHRVVKAEHANGSTVHKQMSLSSLKMCRIRLIVLGMSSIH